MSEDRTEEDTAFDADQLAALARPSLPPTQDRHVDDDDDGALDLKALTASMAPTAASDEPDDDDQDDGVVSVAGATSSGVSGSKASGSKASGSKTTNTKPSTNKSKGKKSSGKGKSSESKSSGGKSSESSGKRAEDAEKKVAVAVAPALEEPQSGGSGKMLIGLIALLGIGGVVFALTRSPEPEEQAALYPPAVETTAAPEQVNEQPAAETPEPTTPDEAIEALPEPEPQDENEMDEPAAEPAPSAAVTDDNRARRETSTASEPATMAAAATTETASATMEAVAPPSMESEAPAVAPTMAASTSMDDMDDLLTRALGGTPTAGGTMTEATMEVAMEDRSSLPETPSRAAVTRALGGLMPRMRQCAGDQVGMATARLRVDNDGQVVSANIAGSPFGGTPQGACMEGVVRTARFPRFQRTHFDVTYPFSIRALN